MRYITAISLFFLLLIGCSAPSTPTPTSTPTAFPTPTITPTNTTTPTPTPTSMWTATADAEAARIKAAKDYAEIVSRWNAVAAGVTVDIPSFGSVNFLWEDDRFPHPTFKGGDPQAYGAFAKVLLAFFEQGDNFDYLAANRLFTVNLRYGTQPTPGWTFAELADQLSRPDGFGSQDDATRKALKSFSDRIQALAAPLGSAPTAMPLPPTPPPALPTATPLSPASTNLLDALTKAYRAWSSVKTFRVRQTQATVPPAQPSGSTVTNYEVVMPDRYHAVGDQDEVIGIGSTTYRKINNQWQRQKQNDATVIPSSGTLPYTVDPKQQEALFASARLAGFIKDVKLLGSEVLDGTPTLVYEVTILADTSKIWIGVSDDLPRKFESVQNLSKTTIICYDYNADITINPPIP